MGDAFAYEAERTTATFALERLRQRLNLPRPESRNARARGAEPYFPGPSTSPPVDAGGRVTSAARDGAPRTSDAAPGQPRPNRLAALPSALSRCTDLPAPVLVGSFFLNVLGLALPLAMLQIYDRVLPNQATDTLLLLSIGLAAAFILEAVLKVVRSQVMGWSAVHSGFRRELGAVTRLLDARPSDVNRMPASDWMDGLDALGELNAYSGGNSRLILVDLPLAALFLVMILLIGGWLVLVPLVLITGFGALTAMRARVLRDVLSTRGDQDNKRYDFLVECLTGIHTIKSLAMEALMLRRFERLHKSSALASYNTVLLGNKVQAMASLFANVTQVSLVSVGALLVMNGTLSIGALVCCSLLFSRLTQPVIRGLGVWSELQNIELAEKRAARFDTLDLAEAKVGESGADAGVPDISGAIAFARVSHSPAPGAPDVLDDISLTVAPGEFIGLRGEDGSGRSTIAALVTGEVAPSRGAVTIDGLAPSGAHKRALNAWIGYAATNPVVFDGSILDNITMFGPSTKLEPARRAAQLIGLEEDIYRLPEGYDTLLAQGVGDSISSGLMQRITIARVLAMEPKILIFDEANSLLDLRSDRLLLEGLEKLKGEVTTLLISNRPSLLRLANRIFELRGGKLTKAVAQPSPAHRMPDPTPENIVA